MELFLCHNIVGVRCNPLWHKQPGYRWFWKNSWWSFLHCTCTLKKRTNHLKIVINGILPHDDYSFELHQERVCGQVPHPLLLLPSLSLIHTFWHIAWQVSITHFWWLPGLPLSYPTVSHLSTHSFLMRLKWINDHQASYVR